MSTSDSHPTDPRDTTTGRRIRLTRDRTEAPAPPAGHVPAATPEPLSKPGVDPESVPQPHDYALLRVILLKLTAAAKIGTGVLVIVIALVWYALLGRLLDFGRHLDFSDNHLVGTEASALLQRYNPYFWTVLGLLFTVLVIYFTWLIVRALAARARQRSLDTGSFARLTDELSKPALDVLLWVWRTPDEPLCVADLQRTRQEMKAGRAGRLHQANRQREALEQARAR